MRKLFSIALFAAICQPLFAQQIPVVNLYNTNAFLINPAAAGQNNHATAYLLHRRQWVSMPNAPVTSIATFDTRLNKSNMGLGGSIFHDQTHVVNKIGAQFTYAYHIPFNKAKDHALSIGLSAGAFNQRIDFQRAQVENPNDNTLYAQDANAFAFDFSAGINYRLKGFNLGVAAPQLLNNQVSYMRGPNNEISYQLERHYLAHASYKFELGKSKSFMIQPMVLARYMENLPFQFEGSLLLGWKNNFFLGGGYRMSNYSAVNGTAGVNIKKSVALFYNIESAIDNANFNSLGLSHEIGVAYKFGGILKNTEEMDKLKEDMENLKKQQRITKERLNEQTQRLDSVQQINDVQDKSIEELLRQVGDLKTQNESNLKDLLDKHEREIKELREKLERLKGNRFQYKRIGSVNFGKNSSELDEAGKRKADALKKLLDAKGDNFVIYIAGSASEEGNEQYNLLLSLKRAAAVKQYLTSVGAKSEQIVLLPYGEQNPESAKQNTEDERNNERRVDIYVTGASDE